ncbi:ECF-type sigma factor [Solimonas soli]|uniref:ECF-type sigma factor n=1 Tax=Solimonas soli TaxID=413479 RepID=UPI000482E45C|nr:ECF-type sigma factor [Solimonas soli]
MRPQAARASITQLLARARDGDAPALDEAYAAVYGELKRIAHHQLGRERGAFDTTALVHEAYLKLAAGARPSAHDRHHLLSLSARAMRQVLVDHARYVHAHKRDAGAPTLSFEDAMAATTVDALDILTVDDTIQALQNVDPRMARIVELRCFGGYDVTEIAQIMALPAYTVRRDWRKARALLLAELGA